MIKNILAAIGAVTVGAIALGAVIGHCAVTTADDDDFDLEKDLRKARDYCRKKAEELDEDEDDDEEDEGEPRCLPSLSSKFMPTRTNRKRKTPRPPSRMKPPTRQRMFPLKMPKKSLRSPTPRRSRMQSKEAYL